MKFWQQTNPWGVWWNSKTLNKLLIVNECIPCSPGYYCPSDGLIEPVGQCNAGHYCELSSIEASPVSKVYGYRCPVGHYCPQGTPTPIECPNSQKYHAMKFWQQTNPWGVWWNSKTLNKLLIVYLSFFFKTCFKFSQMINNLIILIFLSLFFLLGKSCPLGTFNNGTGLRYANECIPCSPGYYCPFQLYHGG
jgi:hypothetical protein